MTSDIGKVSRSHNDVRGCSARFTITIW